MSTRSKIGKKREIVATTLKTVQGKMDDVKGWNQGYFHNRMDHTVCFVGALSYAEQVVEGADPGFLYDEGDVSHNIQLTSVGSDEGHAIESLLAKHIIRLFKKRMVADFNLDDEVFFQDEFGGETKLTKKELERRINRELTGILKEDPVAIITGFNDHDKTTQKDVEKVIRAVQKEIAKKPRKR